MKRYYNPVSKEISTVRNGETKKFKNHYCFLHAVINKEISLRWKNEYVFSLLNAYKQNCNLKHYAIDVGDVFILRNEHGKRASWKI